jgi:hypothetical protein
MMSSKILCVVGLCFKGYLGFSFPSTVVLCCDAIVFSNRVAFPVTPEYAVHCLQPATNIRWGTNTTASCRASRHAMQVFILE